MFDDLIMVLSTGEPALFELVSDYLFLVPILLILVLPKVLYSEILLIWFLLFILLLFVLLFDIALGYI